MILVSHMGPILFIIGFLPLICASSTIQKSKRQIYREQVLPSRGGKIPDAAFQSDRLALNRLNKEGISIPDGVLLEQRNVYSHPHINKHDPEDENSLLHVIKTPEDRYVAPPGRVYKQNPPTVPSTYLIRKPIGSENAIKNPAVPQIPFNAFNEPHEPHLHHLSHKKYYTQHFVSDNFQHSPRLPLNLPTQPSLNLGHHIPSPPLPHFPSPPFSSQTHPPGIPPQKYSPPQIPTNNYLPPEVPSNRYLPTVDSNTYIHADARPQIYGSVNFEVPKNYLSSTSNVIRHSYPNGYNSAVSFQTVSFYPVTKPLELPNRDVLNNDYLITKSQEVSEKLVSSLGESQNVVILPAILHKYERYTERIDPNGEPTQFFSSEVLGGVNSVSNYDPANGGRYARNSKEIYFTTNKAESNALSDQIIQSKCANGMDNTVEDNSTQCHMLY